MLSEDDFVIGGRGSEYIPPSLSKDESDKLWKRGKYAEDELMIESSKKVAEDKKYFIPSIEDVRVGYECETWHSYDRPIFEKDVIDGEWELSFLEQYIKDGALRTSFLSKEDIEGEGWELSQVLEEDDDENDMFSTGFEKYIDENNWYSLVQKENNKIIIYKSWYRNSVTRLTKVLFYGECKDINTFRYINKLLGI